MRRKDIKLIARALNEAKPARRSQPEGYSIWAFAVTKIRFALQEAMGDAFDAARFLRMCENGEAKQ